MDMQAIGLIEAALVASILIGTLMLAVRSAQDGRRQEEIVRLLQEMRQSGTDVGSVLREEGRHGREEAGVAARNLRDELGGSLGRLHEVIGQTLEQLGANQTERLGSVETQVRRLMTETEQRQEQLRSVIERRLGEIRADAAGSAKSTREETAEALRKHGDGLRGSVQEMGAAQILRLDEMKTTVQGRLDILRQENEAKLEQMRQTVDEKLQGTLEKRLGESFGLVSKQLEQVHKSVGEMQTLATGVGDLKRVLTNVKTRGTWGEVSLGALLEQVMTAEQFARNVEVVPESNRRVEFAIRLPGDGAGTVWLPIDAKFPLEDYERLIEASHNGDKEAEEAAAREVEKRVRQAARDICDKYIHAPYSTDFGILYLPTEGLYAEVLRRPGLSSALQLECKVVVAGPTTLLALLSSLQVGFRSLAIQQRSSEVWELLGAIKTEFGKYGGVLDKVQKRLRQADNDIEQVRVRGRAIGRRLRSVEGLTDGETNKLLFDDYLATEDTLPLIEQREPAHAAE